MLSWGKILSGVVLVGALIPSAYAGDHPPLSPLRDAVVTYRFQTEALPGGQPGAAAEHMVSVSFATSGDRLRIDPDDGQSATILNRPAQIMTLISMPAHRYIEFRPMQGLHNPFFLDLGMTYHKAGEDKIAGVACRKWAIESEHGKAEACVTDDGLILAEDGVDADGVSGHMRAVSVSYQELPASRFLPPAGFEKFDPLAKMKKHAEQQQPVPGVSLGRHRSKQPTLEAEVPSPAGDQPHTPDDSVGDGSVAHDDQPSNGPQ